MVVNKEILDEKRGELAGVLAAISVVSRKLAVQLSALERRQNISQGEKSPKYYFCKGGECFENER